MRIRWLLLALALAPCGDHAASIDARPSPTPTPIPWTSAKAIPTPNPTPTPPLRPSDVRDCPPADVVATVGRSQGAGGWWIRPIFFANRGATACLLTGPNAVAYLDGPVTVIRREGTAPPSWSAPGWAMLSPDPSSVSDSPRAYLSIQTYGDCLHRPADAIEMRFLGATGTITAAMEREEVRGRCDVPGEQLMLGWLSLAWTPPPPYPTPLPLPVTFSIDAPPVAFAGETLRYLVRMRITAAQPFAWGGCPIYIESLGGRDVSPSDVPGHAPKPPDKVYAGFWKELHSLNCDAAGPVAPGADIAFEMLMAVPRDAYGPDTLRWEIAGPFPAARLSSPIQILAPRR